MLLSFRNRKIRQRRLQLLQHDTASGVSGPERLVARW
uniref:Uncharacterized protein n=1 Tax=Arundo donax TaxID=35708 RepID=A0A0A8Y6H7_ARUDO